ncbi:dipeptide ABC transporter ATP-binding protein [uncultured Friedmanniella sp.]|uniref:dipeptide ABC transporter ATP-binding protein n=1 Tax=uncultured Friedmanniella sp. TaxID=335381 RepID=UPI0035CC63EE
MSERDGGTALVEVTGLEVGYRRHRVVQPAVRGVDLRVAQGEVVAVVGGSGSGKTTLASAVLGLLPTNGVVTGGRIEVDGSDVTGAPDRVLRRLRGSFIGLVPQDPTVGLNPTIRVGAQVGEAVRRRGVPARSVDAEVAEVLAAAGVDQPVLRARQYPHELSGGLRQRILIAIALAGQPKLIIADEPTSALDVTVQKKILDHLQHLVQDRGIAMMIITHDLGVAADRADRLLVMSEGRVVETGPARTVLAQPTHAYTRQLIATAPGLSATGELTARHQQVADAPVLLELQGVTKDFPLPRGAASRTLRAVDAVSVSAYRGQTLAVVGESGSGKTTAVRVALGLEPATAGRVVFDGTELTALSARQLRPLRQRFQLVQQNPFAALDPRFTVQQSIVEPLVSQGLDDRRARRERARELLDAVGLPRTFDDRLPAELSGGQRQRVAIARALAVRPELVFLDEPVSALDVSVQSQILTLLRELQDELGLTYVLVSHDLAVVAQVAHQIAVLRRGRVVEQGPAAQLLAHPAEDYTQALLDAVPGRSAQLADQ